MTYKVLKPFQAKSGEKLVEFKEGQIIKPPEQLEKVLTETGKIKSLEVTPNQFESIFKDTADELNKNHSQGLVAHTRQKYPGRWQQSIEAENRINGIWDTGKDLEAFQKAVSEWREIELELIKLFLSQQGEYNAG